MSDKNPEESYNVYIRKLNYDDLIDIKNHLDRKKFPEKYKTVSEKLKEIEHDKGFIKKKESQEKEFNSKASTFATAIGALVAIVMFEYLLKLIFSGSVTSRQIGRIVFILAVTCYVANRTRKDFDASLKTLKTISLTGLGISLFIGVLPRYFESGLEPAIDLMVLRENMLFSPEGITYSFKSNLIVLFGYAFACWGSWCVLLNIYKR